MNVTTVCSTLAENTANVVQMVSMGTPSLQETVPSVNAQAVVPRHVTTNLDPVPAKITSLVITVTGVNQVQLPK